MPESATTANKMAKQIGGGVVPTSGTTHNAENLAPLQLRMERIMENILGSSGPDLGSSLSKLQLVQHSEPFVQYQWVYRNQNQNIDTRNRVDNE